MEKNDKLLEIKGFFIKSLIIDLICIDLVFIEGEIEKILKLELAELYKILYKNPLLEFEAEFKKLIGNRCSDVDITQHVCFFSPF